MIKLFDVSPKNWSLVVNQTRGTLVISLYKSAAPLPIRVSGYMYIVIAS
jgi:hypothetical protein